MEYVRISFSGERDSVLEELISFLAGKRRKDRKSREYPLRMEEGLEGILSWIEKDVVSNDHSEAIEISRIYVPVFENIKMILIAGTPSAEWEEFISSCNEVGLSGVTMERIESSLDDSNWGLVSVILPGWVLLFEDDREYGTREYLFEGIKAAYCPANEDYLDKLSPSLTADRAMLMILFCLLESLPAIEAGEL